MESDEVGRSARHQNAKGLGQPHGRSATNMGASALTGASEIRYQCLDLGIQASAKIP